MTYRLNSVSTYGIRRFRQARVAIASVPTRRTARMAGIVTLCLVLGACGLLDSIKSGWAGTRPFIQNLAVTGVISQAKADAAVRDVDDTLAKATVAEKCVSDITATGNEKKIQKAKCYFQFAQDFRAILARHNIGGDPQHPSPLLDKIALIGQGFIAALEEYFHHVTSMTTAGGRVDTSDADAKLEANIKASRAELKEITGH